MTGKIIIAFTGGGCDGEYLSLCGNRVTRDRFMARTFTDETTARLWIAPRLIGLNRPARSVQCVPERLAP